MATLFRKKNRYGKTLPNWYCSFQVPDKNGEPRQVHRSTGCEKKGDALDRARDLEREAQKEAGADNQTSKAILSKLTEATELAMKGRLNPAQARRLLGEIMEAAGEEGLVSYTLRSWVTEWIREKEATVKPATVAFYRSATNDFIEFMGGRAENHLETVTTKDLRDFRDAVIARGRKRRTANQKMKCLRSLFGDAVKVSALLRNPVAPIKPLLESDTVKTLDYTFEEAKRLLEKAPCEQWRGVILFGVFHGIRIGDIVSLKSGNLDLRRRVVSFVAQKDNKLKVLPLHQELIEYFRENPPSPFDASPIFPEMFGRKSGGRSGLAREFKKIMKEAGVSQFKTEKSADGSERVLGKRLFHALRHSCTSFLAEAGVPPEIRMELIGHSDVKVHQHYTHHKLENLRAHLDRIPSFQESHSPNQTKNDEKPDTENRNKGVS